MPQMTGYKEKQRIEKAQHFFAASTWDWATTTPERDLPALIKYMEKQGRGFNLFLVPVSFDTDYDINFFQPQVDGTQWLGFFNGESK
jgi:hypothetical protein